MINFEPIHTKQVTFAQFFAALSLSGDEMRSLTDEMVDAMQALISNAVDADVTFEPADPAKDDKYATNPDEKDLAWNLAHVIVHATASSEESAALAAELARGVEYHGRSRSEIPWHEVTTIVQCRQRLEESRRMRLASLEMWPEHPHLDNEYEAWPNGPRLNPISRFVFGLMHDDSHLAQIAEIVRQARAARSV